MKAAGRGVVEGRSRFSLGKALVIVQVALSFVLLVGAGLLLETLQRLASMDPGFEHSHVLLMRVDLSNGHYAAENRGAAYREMLGRLRAIPGVLTASYSDYTPITPGRNGHMVVVEGSKAKPKSSLFNKVGDGYFETLATPILAGRDFTPHDTAGSPRIAILNQAMVRKLFGDTNPLGKRYQLAKIDQQGTHFSDPVEIVGVVRDSKFNSLREETLPMIFTPVSQKKEPDLFLTFELRAAHSPAELIPAVKSAMAQVNRDVALDFVTLSAQVDASLTRERLLATLSTFFGGLALLLAAIGLYGTISYTVTRRKTEIGIRVALGAERGTIQRWVLGEVAVLATAGLIVGIGGALPATRLVKSFLYGLKPTDAMTLVLAGALLGGVALVAGYLPARRASKLDPMMVLREE
jgi:putative ABC transport system permease protein